MIATAAKTGVRKKILVVDDEASLLRALKSVLSQRDYEFLPATSGEEALEYVVRDDPDAVILDLTLPGISGFEVCRSIREWSDVPILVLSVREADADKIAALDLGADDYLTKPFSSGELLARLRAVLRRARTEEPPVTLVNAGPLAIDLEARTVSKSGETVALTRTEFDILGLLARNADRVITTRAIVDEVWGRSEKRGTQALRVHVSHLRSKIEDDPSGPRLVVTEPGVGYRLNTGQ